MEDIAVLLPQNLENMELPAPELVNYWRLAENRIYYIDVEIDETVLEIQKVIINHNIEDAGKDVKDRKPIIIMLNTPGGLMEESMCIATTIAASTTPVITVNVAGAYSGGAIILMAGHKRFTFPYAKALIHTGETSGAAGTFEQAKAMQELYNEEVAEMGDFILAHTHIDKKTFKQRKATDWYFNAEEQLKYGIVDEEVSNFEQIFSYKFE